ncbi:hypothetical protein C8F01DRAFT_1368274 [Mycena amicta]|nr:hypothetical protein C8F01DRAFT_1368274 [Mycena amicta]
MKLLSIALAALLSFTQLATVTAAPVPYPADVSDLDVRGITGSKLLAPPSAHDLITQKLIKAPRKDKSLFWTGTQTQIGNLRRLKNIALDLAAAQGFDIVGEMLKPAALALVNDPKGPLSKLSAEAATKFVEDFWDNASEAFAELSTGQVTVMMEGDPATGPQPEASSVFQRIERPILEQRSSHGVQLVSGVDRIGRDFKTTGVRVPFAL